MRPDAAVIRLSPPLDARPLTTPGHLQWPEPPRFSDATASSPPAVEELTPSLDPTTRPLRRCGRVRAVRNSPSDVAACHRVVRRHTCSLVTRRSTRARQVRAVPGAHVGQPAPKAPSEASYEARNEPEKCLGNAMAGRSRALFVTKRHKNVMIWPFLLGCRNGPGSSRDRPSRYGRHHSDGPSCCYSCSHR